MHTVGRWALRVPDGTDGPPNIPLWMDRLAADLTDVAKDNQGTLGARPTSTVLAPGTAGRYFTTTDEDDPAGVDRRRVYRDAGTEWDEFATVPISDRMVGAGQLTEAKTATGADGLGKGAFAVYRTAALTLATGGTILFDTEDFDLSNWYNPATGRYTPQVSGLYFLAWAATLTTAVAVDTYLSANLRKNGVQIASGMPGWQRAGTAVASHGAWQVQANGSTDYFDVIVSHNAAGSPAFSTPSRQTRFAGHLIGRA